MTKPVCRICSESVSEQFSSNLLNKYSVKYFYCSICGYVQTEAPYWLEEAYANPINDSDTGIMMRSLWHRNVASTLIYLFFDKNGIFLDFGGGYGVFVRLMRDIGFDYFWHDKYTKNFFAQGFEFSENKNTQVELLTCFEAFEHFNEPIKELEKLLKVSRNILLSTEFIPGPIPHPNDWWYYGIEHGQHIGFFQKKTFEYLAEQYSLQFYTNGQNIHLLTEKLFPLSTFKWLTKFSKIISPLIKTRMDSLTWKDSNTVKAPL
ncbi:MAG: class I SAM-dependent methyltransferase [bacterium]